MFGHTFGKNLFIVNKKMLDQAPVIKFEVDIRGVYGTLPKMFSRFFCREL